MHLQPHIIPSRSLCRHGFKRIHDAIPPVQVIVVLDVKLHDGEMPNLAPSSVSAADVMGLDVSAETHSKAGVELQLWGMCRNSTLVNAEQARAIAGSTDRSKEGATEHFTALARSSRRCPASSRHIAY
jgi:hypothetical protein